MIPVTKSFLPPIDLYMSQVQRAWNKQWLTNRGELVLELETKLKEYLDVSNIIITNNGTIPLQIALKILGNKGEVITTPFSYVATAAAIIWENCTPVFVDIHPEYLTIDENKIEEAINPSTTAILATHVFGNPCNVEKIDMIAKKYNLKIIYDAAHSFGVKFKGKSMFNYGDVATCSFHATKLFHTAEGGAIFSNDETLNHKLFYSHNFGHNGTLDFFGLGINGKISELQAAMGLSVFPYLSEIMATRKSSVEFYDRHLDFSVIRKIKIRENTTWNYSYYPVIFSTEEQLLKVQSALLENDILPRRYFYPSLNTVNYISGKSMPVSESVSVRILCLPLYANMEEKDLAKICTIINQNVC